MIVIDDRAILVTTKTRGRIHLAGFDGLIWGYKTLCQCRVAMPVRHQLTDALIEYGDHWLDADSICVHCHERWRILHDHQEAEDRRLANVRMVVADALMAHTSASGTRGICSCGAKFTYQHRAARVTAALDAERMLRSSR